MEHEFRQAMSHFATGVAIVTAASDRGPVGMTANALCSLSLEPLQLLVCFENDSRTLPAVRTSGRFAVNVLAGDQQALAARFASKLPEHEKFAGIPHDVAHGGVPIIEGSLAWLACDLRELIPGGDHQIAIGGVTAIDVSDGDPLLWYLGSYRALG